MHHAILLQRIRQSGLVAASALVLSLGSPAAGEEPASGGLVTSTTNPTAMGPAAVSAAKAPASPATSEAVGGMTDEMPPPAALAPADEPDPVLERMRAEQDLKDAHARLQEADRAVAKMLRRNYPRGDPRAELLAEQTAAERSFHEAQSAVDHLDSRDGW